MKKSDENAIFDKNFTVQRRIQNPVKYLRWRFLRNIFTNKLYHTFFIGSEYAFGVSKLYVTTFLIHRSNHPNFLYEIAVLK